MGGEEDDKAAQAQVAGEPQAQGDDAAAQVQVSDKGAITGGESDKARADYEAALRERDERIAALEGEIAEGGQDRRGRRSAPQGDGRATPEGRRRARGVRAPASRARATSRRRGRCSPTTRTTLDKLKAAEPWLFGIGGCPLPAPTGATGLPNAGAATDEGAQMKALAKDRRHRRRGGIGHGELSSLATKNYTSILDEVYMRAACSTCLNSPRRMARAGRNAKEIMVPKIEVSGLGNYTPKRWVQDRVDHLRVRDQETFNYDRGIRLLADVMDVEEAGVARTASWRRARSSNARRWRRRLTPSRSPRSRGTRA